MLKIVTAWDGEIEAIGVEDTDGGVWWPNDEANAEIMASADPQATALTMCEAEPTRGEWFN